MSGFRWMWATLTLLLTALALVTPWDTLALGAWPAPGLAVATYVFAGRKGARYFVLPVFLAFGVGLLLGNPVPWRLAWPAAASYAVFTYLTWHTLTAGGRHRFSRPKTGGSLAQFFLVTMGFSIANGIVLGLLGTLELSVTKTLVMASMSTLASFTAQSMILPLFWFSPNPARASQFEQMVQRGAILVALLVFLSPAWSLASPFLLIPFLAWAASRLTMRETVIQLNVVCLTIFSGVCFGVSDLGVSAESISESYTPVLVQLMILACATAIIPVTLLMDELVGASTGARRAAAAVERILESATGAVIIATDATGLITLFNAGARDATGWSEEEAIGKSPVELALLTDAELKRQSDELQLPHDPNALAAAYVASGRRNRWIVSRKDGGESVVSLTLSEMIDDSTGELVGYIAAGEDVSDQQRATHVMVTALAREQAAVRRLREADRMKQDLVSTVSHELRTPVTSIAGYAELLADGIAGDISSEQAQFVSRIEVNAARLSLLVDDLLVLARAESGDEATAHRSVDLVHCLDAVEDVVSEMLRPRWLTYSVDLPDEPVIVTGDPNSLERVLINLLSNAIKFTPDGGRIEVKLHRLNDGTVEFSVIDSGIGIAQSDVPRLFTRFFRTSSAVQSAIPGTGLGLPIVQHLVEQHRGLVSVDSELGHGSTFTVRLPNAQTSDQRPAS